MARSSALARADEGRTRGMRLGFRVHAGTKSLVERAAALERRSLTDFCLVALTEAAQHTITRHESLSLSARDRAAFFDAMVHPPKANARLRRAFRTAAEQVASR
jgi:uncharacterized protein (DUF1778 family)